MIWLEIRCDLCGITGLSCSKTYAHKMRGELRKQGWLSFETGKDYCPQCKSKRNQKPPQDPT